MSGKSYPVRTIIDMARIPPEAWPKLMEELPALLAPIAALVSIYDALRENGNDIPDAAYDNLLAQCDWIDDDKGEANVTVTAHGTDGEELFHSANRFKINPSSAA